MEISKGGTVNSLDESSYEMDIKGGMKGTTADERDMQVLGKSQELNVSRRMVRLLSEPSH